MRDSTSTRNTNAVNRRRFLGLCAGVAGALIITKPAVASIATPRARELSFDHLHTGEKIKLAYLGSKDARRLLSRDTNRVVQRAVLQSPKIREDEVLPIVQDRTVAEEILRLVIGRKDWIKNYPIRLALCQNPKTPAPRAMRLLETLQDRDLRNISKSRNVPSPISAGAIRILARRGKT